MTRRRSRAVPLTAAASVLAAAALLAAPSTASVLIAPGPLGTSAVGLPSGFPGFSYRVMGFGQRRSRRVVTSLPADALVVDGAACSADGALVVLPGTADGVSGLTADVLRGVEACFTSGIVSEALTCGRWAGPVNNATYFFGGGDVLTVGEGASAVELPAAPRFLSVAGRGDMVMADLKLGDRVRVSATAFEPIVLFTHRDPAGVGAYVALTTAGGRVLVATTGHLVYAADEATAGGWALKAAGSVA
ncbi:hypothetical protein BU14_0169s0020, partial [Porphyra umbilicalis]